MHANAAEPKDRLRSRCHLQALLSDQQGRTLIIEPGLGWREKRGRYALITNYSILAPESTRPFLVPGDDRYERAAQLLNTFGKQFTVTCVFCSAGCPPGRNVGNQSFVRLFSNGARCLLCAEQRFFADQTPRIFTALKGQKP